MTPEPSPSDDDEVDTTETTLGSTAAATDSMVPVVPWADAVSDGVCWVSEWSTDAATVAVELFPASRPPYSPAPKPAARASTTVAAMTATVRRPRPAGFTGGASCTVACDGNGVCWAPQAAF